MVVADHWPASRPIHSNGVWLSLERLISLRHNVLLPKLLSDADRERLEGMTAKRGGVGMSRGKVKRFLAREIPHDFATRQLNDTGSAALQIIGQLRRLWPDVGQKAPVNVEAVTGRVTDHLRRLWGLHDILADHGKKKNRKDHRHHAIDALTIACADPGMTNRLSQYWQRSDEPWAKRPTIPLPWPTIRADAEKAIEAIVVSHRVRKKVSGALHKETIYGDTKEDKTTGNITYRKFVTRKKVEELSVAALEFIEDDRVREIVKEWVAAHGGNPKKAFPPYPRLGKTGPEIRKVRWWIKRQKRLMAPVGTGYAVPKAKHHVAIYRTAAGKVISEVVSLFEAAGRLARREPVMRRTREDGADFVMSLSPGDALEFSHGEKQGVWIVQGVWSGRQIVLAKDTDALGETVWRPNPTAILRDGGRKISIDPIGRVRVARD